ncbi:enoyl-CoA hydratase-related protein [Agrobacterium tumefaciens]|uniref:Enoyl-CoA hydratase n=1 Tax=Agrobacterium tumefaciens TaxID=358 RepID=A0AA44F2Y5_AGRTU|nr:enoyl-CoA hydratase-related protein [Agrobacterium tumefaciens]NSL23053.1 enoyl-CoA hydratase [Agrobacterium tumefaciens]NTB89294.1 enoyl-CoA hydratase [Agrobacterium tumefaciens]NTC20564.1 enoyl-CoA hydratase [Agrobacterium tumefaciens]NTC27935.1 enoyl-CoA hydratase [Agrobacterium tumefaciens]NTC53551.1 enoyl-CoA hydratase [Agrobacterium tumefaciens]
MTEDLVKSVTYDGFAHVELNRPAKRNALNAEMLSELVRLLDHYSLDPAVRALVITGNERGFAAGADIGTLGSATPIELSQSGFSDHWDQVAAQPKPLIAGVSSFALGGGLELALACDIVIADSSAIFGLPETSIGVIPGAGGTQRLVRAVGKSMAMEMILAGRKLNAQEAKEAGLISTVVGADETVEDRAFAIASAIASGAPLAVRFAKAAVLQSFETSLSTGILFERSLSALIAASEDRKEGMAAFAEKRSPQFKGR